MDLIKCYNDLPIGKKNAITKIELQCKWGMSERMVRKTISDLRAMDLDDDFVIVSLSTGKGYFKTNDIDEIRAFKKEVTNRGRHTFTPLRKVNKILAMQSMPNALREKRLALNISTKEAIEYVRAVDPNFDKSLLSKIENGRCNPTNNQLFRLAELYESTPEELAGVLVI